MGKLITVFVLLLVGSFILVNNLSPEVKEWAEYKKTAVTSCFSDGEVFLCRRTWLEPGNSPLKDIDLCWMQYRPKIDGNAFAISCEKYDKIKNSLND